MNRYSLVVHSKAKEFIEKLDKTQKARVDRLYSLFEQYGPLLPNKYLKKIGQRVWELRPGDTRLFLTIISNRAYIVHGMFKKTQKTPKKKLDVAIKRIKEIV